MPSVRDPLSLPNQAAMCEGEAGGPGHPIYGSILKPREDLAPEDLRILPTVLVVPLPLGSSVLLHPLNL